MAIFIWRDNTQHGPYSKDEIKKRLKEGDLSPNDFAWREGQTEWTPLRSILQTAPSLPGTEANTLSSKGTFIASTSLVMVLAVFFFVIHFLGTNENKKEPQVAVHLDRKAVEQGDVIPSGTNNKEKHQVVVESDQKSAEQGDAKAQYNLGVRYAKGDGVAQDLTQAVSWYRKSAEQGYAKAQNNLGNCYAEGNGVPQDLTQAVIWCRKSAEQGDAMAQYNLASCYRTGNGAPQDLTQAVIWYRKSAEQGYAKAQRYLGLCYTTGSGVTEDREQAASWYRKSAEQGDANAQCHLGFSYAQGQGVPQDLTQAIIWLRKAAEQGNAFAVEALKRFDSGNHQMAAQSDRKVTELGNEITQYRKAAEQGDVDAKVFMLELRAVFGEDKGDDELLQLMDKTIDGWRGLKLSELTHLLQKIQATAMTCHMSLEKLTEHMAMYNQMAQQKGLGGRGGVNAETALKVAISASVVSEIGTKK